MLKLISRILSLVICFQLAVGCNTYSTSTTINDLEAPVPDGFIRFNGIISKAFNTITNSIFPQAMAAEGEVIFYDVTDPGAPQEIHRKSISGTDSFSVDLKEEDIKSGLIRVRFEPTDPDPLKEREFLTVASQKMTATMSNEESIKSEILLYQLNVENSNSLLDLNLIKDRFNDLNSTIDLDEEVNRFGDANSLKTLLSNPDDRPGMIALLAHARVAQETDKINIIDIQTKFFSRAHELGLIKEELLLKCDHTGAALFLSENDGSRNFFMEADAVEMGLIEKVGQNLKLENSSFQYFDQANERIKEIVALLDKMRNETGEIFSVKISFKSNDTSRPLPKNECRIFPSNLKKDHYEKLLIDDPSVNLRFDLKYIDDIDLTSFQSVVAAQAAFDDARTLGLETLTKQLIELGVKEDLVIDIIQNQKNRVDYYIKEKILAFSENLKTAEVLFDKSILDSVTTSNTATFWEAFELLRSKYDETIVDLKRRLLEEKGMDKTDALPIFKEQSRIASEYLIEKAVILYDHHIVLEDSGLVVFHEDLTEIKKLDPANFVSVTEYGEKVSSIYIQGTSAINQRLIDQKISPSPKDRQYLDDRFIICVKLKDHTGHAYFNNLFSP